MPLNEVILGFTWETSLAGRNSSKLCIPKNCLIWRMCLKKSSNIFQENIPRKWACQSHIISPCYGFRCGKKHVQPFVPRRYSFDLAMTTDTSKSTTQGVTGLSKQTTGWMLGLFIVRSLIACIDNHTSQYTTISGWLNHVKSPIFDCSTTPPKSGGLSLWSRQAPINS